MTMIKTCPICKSEFKTYKSKVKLGRGKYCSRECSFQITNRILAENGKKTQFIKGKQHAWHNHRHPNGAGYILVHNHTLYGKTGRKREHRLIMEQFLGRKLERNEDVHHINGIRDDNRIENLEVLTHAEHTRKNNPVKARWCQ